MVWLLQEWCGLYLPCFLFSPEKNESRGGEKIEKEGRWGEEEKNRKTGIFYFKIHSKESYFLKFMRFGYCFSLIFLRARACVCVYVYMYVYVLLEKIKYHGVFYFLKWISYFPSIPNLLQRMCKHSKNCYAQWCTKFPQRRVGGIISLY